MAVFCNIWSNQTRKRRAISLFSFALLITSLASVVSSLGSTSTNQIPDTLKQFSDEKQIDKIEKNVRHEVESIVQHVLSYYRKIVDEKRTLINSLVHANVEFPVLVGENGKVNVEEAANFTSKLNTDYRVVSELVSELNNSTKSFKDLAEKINGTLTIMGINTCESNVLNISNHFETLKRFNSKPQPLPTFQWAASQFQSIVDLLTNSRQTIQIDINSTAEKLFKRLNETIYDISNELVRSRLSQMQFMPIQQLSIELSRNYSQLHNMTHELNRSTNSTLMSMKVIFENVRQLRSRSNRMVNWLIIVSNRARQISYLNALSHHDYKSSQIWSREWAVAFKRPTELILNSSKWYTFLADLYSKFGEFEFQSNLDQKLLQQSLKNQNDLDKFLTKLAIFNISEIDSIKNVQISSSQFAELNQLLNLTLRDAKFRYKCEDNMLTITGDYVKLSDLISSDKKMRKDLCPGLSKFESVNIFSTNTIFIDCDLDAMGDHLKLTILAPKWEIIGVANRTIVLDGSFVQSSVGTFLGIGHQFVITNGNFLTISANGGAGLSGVVKIFNLGNSTTTGIVTQGNSQLNEPSNSSHFANRIQEYKTFLWNQLNDDNESYRFKGPSITQFLAQLYRVNAAYDLLDWFCELEIVEQVHVSNKNRAILIHSYESLVKQFRNQLYSDGSFDWSNTSQQAPHSYLFFVASIQLFNLEKDFDKKLAKLNIHYAAGDLFSILVGKVNEILPKLRKQHDLNDALGLMMELYQMIFSADQLFHRTEEQELEQYFPSFNRTDFEKNPQMYEALDRLDSRIRAYFVQQLYQATVVTLKQLVFPYAHSYLDTYPQLINKLRMNNSNDLEALINEAVNKIAKMLSQSTKNNYLKASIPQNYSRGHSNYSFEIDQNDPFYVWTNDQHADTITRLLYGEAVTLKADVLESDPRKDAIKFNTIEFKFKARNASKQAEIDQILHKCPLNFTAVQTGNSYYRYGGKYYSIRNAPMTIYKGKEKMMHLKMVGASSLMLSPYATWKIKMLDCEESILGELRLANADEMDLVLVGQGSYVESKDSDTDDDLHVEHYYREYSVNMSSAANVEQIDMDTADQYDEYSMSQYIFFGAMAMG